MKSEKISNCKFMFITASLFIWAIFSVLELKSENLKELIDLSGTWRFSVGDNPKWSQPDYNTRKWDYVSLPQNWESAGYVGYDGYAWYRKDFRINNSFNKTNLYLVLGYIDDVDEVYLNGHLIGRTGVFPPAVKTSFSLLRKYHIPKEFLNNDGNNVIAIRVFDEYHNGGIYNGPLGIYYDGDSELLVKDLSGLWEFAESAESNNNSTIFVPGHLESRGYHSLVGAVTFSRDFIFENPNDSKNLMIVLGYIDGAEMVFLNGNMIGTIDKLRNSGNEDLPLANLIRGYIISVEQLNSGKNRIEIVIENNNMGGGIIEGPVGLIHKDNFSKLKNKPIQETNNPWKEFLEYLWE